MPNLKRIYKERLDELLNCPSDGHQQHLIQATVNARILTAQLQNGIACVWYEFEEGDEPATWAIACVGTGFGAVPPDHTYLTTLQWGSFVWHLYVSNEPV